ncbi:MAG TPA: hypothetical protein VGX69_05970 [Solirubrobacteraceae bacterium]|jgi:hypothetical protein|nr:hypothetical protein [Solirubrobacteraceae bacterium]
MQQITTERRSADVLQIVTKMFFRSGVPLHSTVHREVLYTNRFFLPLGVVVQLPVGELAPSTAMRPVSTAALSVIEHLEAEMPDGEPSMIVATGGTELLDDLADVLSFGLNAIFTRDHDLARSLVPNSVQGSAQSEASKLFRHTFAPHRFVPDTELEELKRFMAQLLALNRSHFEAAMRAIRRIIHATQHAVDDPTLAYVDLVAALESLSDGKGAPAPTWDQMNDDRRKLIDAALEDADTQLVDRVREAVMQADRLGAKSRFVAFVMDNVSPSYFRTEATDSSRPVRGADLQRALKLAYDVRSRNVHVLKDLPSEAWVLGDAADTVMPISEGIMLSHEGLLRLARHVVKNYVDRAPAETDFTFDWRTFLPGKVQMRLAPQYWVWQADGFDHKSVARYFTGFIGHALDALAARSEGVTNMQAVLERIEQQVPGIADGPDKTMMVAMYALWHDILAPSEHRREATKFLARHGQLLERLEIPSFVVGLLTGHMPDWTADQLQALATRRRTEREKRKHLELPAVLDVALQVVAAESLLEQGRNDDVRRLAGFAVEELPGYEPLSAWESALHAGEPASLDLRELVLQTASPDDPSDEAPSEGTDHEVDPEPPAE